MEVRRLALELANGSFYDSPKENVARAAAYYHFLKRGPILEDPAAAKRRKGIKTGGKR